MPIPVDDLLNPPPPPPSSPPKEERPRFSVRKLVLEVLNSQPDLAFDRYEMAREVEKKLPGASPIRGFFMGPLHRALRKLGTRSLCRCVCPICSALCLMRSLMKGWPQKMFRRVAHPVFQLIHRRDSTKTRVDFLRRYTDRHEYRIWGTHHANCSCE